MTVVLLGDSHIGGYYQLAHSDPAATNLRVKAKVVWIDNGTIAYKFMLSTANGEIRSPVVDIALEHAGVLDRYRNLFTSNASDHMLIFCIGSVENHVLGFNEEWQKFELGYNGRDGIPGLPPSLIEAAIACRLSSFGSVLKQLNDASIPVKILGGPPPTFDNDLIATKNNLQYVPPPSTRLGVYRATCAALSGMAMTAGGTFISTDQWLADENGFLKADYVTDGVHCSNDAAIVVLKGLDLLEPA